MWTKMMPLLVGHEEESATRPYPINLPKTYESRAGQGPEY